MDTNPVAVQPPRLTRQEAEQHIRDLAGAVIDASGNAGIARQLYREGAFAGTKNAGDNLITAQDALINRQSELIAELTNLVRKAVA